jgi:hypothetical protein
VTADPIPGGERASLLDLDPDLASLLGRERSDSLGRQLLMTVVRVPAGTWRPPAGGFPPGTVAFGVLDGLLLREAGSRARASLSGPGDLLEPWSAAPDVRWTALRPLRLAVLGRPLMAALSSSPDVLVRLLARALRQESRRLGAAQDAGSGRDRARAVAPARRAADRGPARGLEATREAVTAAFARASDAYGAAIASTAEVAQSSAATAAARRPPSAPDPRDAAAAAARGRRSPARDAPARPGR